MLTEFSLEGKIAIITGASRGLGKSIALAFADAGTDLVITARTATDIRNTAVEIADQTKRKVIGISADVRSIDQIDDLVHTTIEEFGCIDILVNNAGGTFPASMMNISEKGFDTLIRENLKSVYMCSQAVAKVMMNQKRGAIVNTTSIAGIGCSTFSAPYGASKAGIISLTKTMAVELANYNIRVNAVAPGAMATTATNQFDDLYPGLVKRIPMRRLGKPEEVTGAYIYLASEASSYVTGAVLVLDGGLLAASGIID